MTTTLSPAPFQKFFDNNGAPLSKGLLFTYLAGTTTKTTTWTDSTGGTPNSNPIVLDYRGECNLWISPNVGYKYVLAPATDTDPPTNPIKTIDNIVNSQLITLYGGVDTGINGAYVLNFTANFTSLTNGIIIYWIPSNTNNITSSTLNVNGLGVVPLLNSDGSNTNYNQIVANQMIGVIYRDGNWYIFAYPTITGSFTGTLTGMESATTGTFYYKIINGICTIYTKGNTISGTSNATTFMLTGLPNVVLPIPPTVTSGFTCMVLDNGARKLADGIVNSAAGAPANTIVFSLMTVSGSNLIEGSFTNSGIKGMDKSFSITYPL